MYREQHGEYEYWRSGTRFFYIFLVTYHGSSKLLELFPVLLPAPDDPLLFTFSTCGASISIASSLQLFELVVADSTSISSAILFVSRANNLAPKIELGSNFPRFSCCYGNSKARDFRRFFSSRQRFETLGAFKFPLWSYKFLLWAKEYEHLTLNIFQRMKLNRPSKPKQQSTDNKLGLMLGYCQFCQFPSPIGEG